MCQTNQISVFHDSMIDGSTTSSILILKTLDPSAKSLVSGFDNHILSLLALQ